jgi:hypothetical protein
MDDFNQRPYYQLGSQVIASMGVELRVKAGGTTAATEPGTYQLDAWGEYPPYHERLKQSYFIMRDAYGTYES